jgi:hypothetical protein
MLVRRTLQETHIRCNTHEYVIPFPSVRKKKTENVRVANERPFINTSQKGNPRARVRAFVE